MSQSVEGMSAVNWKKIGLLLVLICLAAYLGGSRYFEYVRLDELEKRAERRRQKKNSPSPIAVTHADAQLLVPLRKLDRFSLRILDSDEWSEELLREAIGAPIKHAGMAEYQRRLTLLDKKIEQFKSRATEIEKLSVPDELVDLHKSDLETYERTLELLRLRRDHLAQVCETGSFLSQVERSALIDNSKELTKDIKASRIQQQELRKAFLQKYNAEAAYRLPSLIPDRPHAEVTRSMLSLLDGKYQISRSLWYWRRQQEETLAELQVAESPPYLLIPQHEARIRYHQSVVDLAKSLMRNEPKTQKELKERGKGAVAKYGEFELEQGILKLYPDLRSL